MLRPHFASHGGTEIKTIGDAFLVEFRSTLDAVLCAIAIQQVMHDRRVARGDDLSLRIGIHVGDVVESGNDILGDAVNVASRIEPLAEPGGICISSDVYNQIRNKVDTPFVSLGEKLLKNLNAPFVVYKATMPWSEGGKSGADQLDRKRIAVLPFSNISPDPADEYFADGMTEELTNAISHNQQLKVIARTTAGRFKGSTKSVSEMAREMGVGSVLEGSVRKAGNRIRVTAQLIDAATEEHVWSDNYDRQVDDVFTIQSEIAGSVSEALRVRLVPKEMKSMARSATVSPSALVRYLKGRASLRGRSEEALREAKMQFEGALEDDPEFAQAYTGLADALFLLGSLGHIPIEKAIGEGRAALAKSLSLDEDLAEAHNTLANFLMQDYKFADAETEFVKALALNQNYSLAHHWYCILLMDMGRVGEGVEEILRAEDLDPLSAPIAYNSAISLSYLGDDAGCEARVKKLLELDPSGMYVDAAVGWVLGMKGDFREGAKRLESAVEKNPRRLDYLAQLGVYYGRLGERDKALKVLGDLADEPGEFYGKPFHLAFAYAAVGDADQVFACLDRAFNERSLEFRSLRFCPVDPDLRKDARYVEVFRRAGLDP